MLFRSNTLAFVYHTLQYDANNVMLIYGESDPWSATALPLIGRTNALKLVIRGAWHNARIGLGTPAQRNEAISTLESWLGIKLKRL